MSPPTDRGAFLDVVLGQVREAVAERGDAEPETPPPEVAKARLNPERLLGRYVLVEPVGQGGAGTVWKAWDGELGRWVAVKVPRTPHSANFRRRFLREARVTASLNHPHLVSIHDAGEAGERPYLVMELIQGKPLDDEGGPRRVADLVRKVALALDVAHRHGVVHRDLKPGNILVDTRGEPHVVDFGLARQDDDAASLTRTGAIVGTPLYMAPEQVRPGAVPVGPRSDVYALGVVLYQLLVGRVPYEGETPFEIFTQILHREPVRPRRRRVGIPRDLEAVCLKAMEKDAARRYGSAADFAADLGRTLDGLPVLAKPLSPMVRLLRRIRRGPAAWGLGALALAGIAGISVLSGALSSEARAAELSDAYYELALKTTGSMRDLEDRWHGGGSDAAAKAAFDQVAAVSARVGAAHPRLGLPKAWRGLAAFYGGTEEEGLREIRAAAVEGDPFPAVILSRALLARYLRRADLPVTYEWGAPARGRILDIGFHETAEMKAILGEAAAALDGASGLRVWGRIRQGAECASYVDGTLLIARGDYAGGARRLAGLRDDPLLQGDAGLLQGIAHFLAGHPREATPAWELLEARGWAKAHYLAGVARLKGALEQEADPAAMTEELERAALDLDAAIDREITQIGAYVARIQVRLKRGEIEGRRRGGSPARHLDRAAAEAEALASIAHDRRSGLWVRAHVNMRIGFLEGARGVDARPRFDRAIETYGSLAGADDDAICFLLRGTCRFEKARSQEALGLDPRESLEAALGDLDRSLALESTPEGHLVRGNARMKLADLEMLRKEDAFPRLRLAIEDYGRSIAAGHALPSSRSNRGVAYYKIADLEALGGQDPFAAYALAIADHDEAVRIDPGVIRIANRASTFLSLARAKAKRKADPTGDVERAIADFDRAIAMDGGDAKLRWLRGQALASRQGWLGRSAPDRSTGERALEDFDAAIALKPAYWEAHRDMGKLLSWLERGDEAREQFERSLAINPDQPDVLERVRTLRPTW